MTPNASKVTIHMVCSLDGFISKSDNTIDWMRSDDHYEKGKSLTQADIESYLTGIDCYVMGANTYKLALELGWPYGEKPVTVVSHQKLPNERDTVDFYSGDLNALLDENLRLSHKNIWMVGGAELTKKCLQQGLADELIVSIMPILLGGGTLFFDAIGKEIRLSLQDSTAYKDGMVELTYLIEK